MTFTTKQTDTYENALNDVFTKIAAATGWSIAHDYRTTDDPNGNQRYAVYDHPHGPGQVAFGGSSNSQGHMGWKDLWARHGDTWDPNNSSFNTGHARSRIYLRDGNNNNIRDYEQVDYWVESVERGFVVVMNRQESDGNDESGALAVQGVDKTWPYHNASNYEAPIAVWHISSESGVTAPQVGSNGAGSHGGFGIRNPDLNFDNYPRMDWVLETNTFRQPNNGERAIIGTVDLLLWDDSGSEVSTGDTVQDGGGNNTYMIFSFNNSGNYAVRMD
jgi:hypothetical protein